MYYFNLNIVSANLVHIYLVLCFCSFQRNKQKNKNPAKTRRDALHSNEKRRIGDSICVVLYTAVVSYNAI